MARRCTAHTRTNPSRPSRKFLVLTSVSVLALALPVHAQAVEIDTETDTPVATSTASNGSPADIEITETGSIETDARDGFHAVTVDSDHSVTNDGLIQIDNSDNAVGILIEAGHRGDIAGSGDILLFEDYARTDDDADDDLDGPLAQGSNRTALLLQAGGDHTGNIVTGSTSSFSVEGNESYGIRLGSRLVGSFVGDGAISVIGDNARGFVAEQGVTGNVLFSGAVQVRGENALAVDLAGDIGGNLTIESSLSSSGFASSTVSNYVAPTAVTSDTPAVADRIDAEDLRSNTGTFAVRGSVANGILINGNVDSFVSDEDRDDETKDTIEDYDENRVGGTISSIGSGPALLVASDSQDIVIGGVLETVRDTLDDDDDDDFTETLATFQYVEGLINRGTINANGLNIGFDASALRIEGAADGSTRVEIVGGMLNQGTISAQAFEASATAAAFGRGADVEQITNTGLIQAAIRTVGDDTATALLIEHGANVPTLTNQRGDITASASGLSGSAWAIRDLSGSLTSIVNKGTIGAAIASDGTNTAQTGSAIAIDLSQHDAATGASLVQEYAVPVDDENGDDVINSKDVDTPSVFGDVLFGAGSDSFDLLAGSTTGNVDFGAGDAAFTLRNSTLTGDTSFADGTHDFDARNATIEGDLLFLNAIASVSLDAGASFTGRIHSTSSQIDLTVTDSGLELETGNRTDLRTLSVTGASDMTFHIDPYDTSGAILNVAGDASIGGEVSIVPVLAAISRDPFSVVLVSADNLDFDGALDESRLGSIPFLYSQELIATETDLSLSFDLKSSDELDLDLNQARAYQALIDVFVSDATLGAAMATLEDASSFYETYNLLLPQRTNSSHQFLSAQNTAAIGALESRLNLLQFADPDTSGLWVQEYFYSLSQDETAESPGYNGEGLGFALGYDRAIGPVDRAGLLLTYSSGSFEERTGGYNPVSTTTFGGGLYATERIGPVQIYAAGQVTTVDFTSSRDFLVDDLIYEIDGEWTGLAQSATLAASTRFDLGGAYLKPQLSVDALMISQDGYTETGTASTDGLFAEISDVETDEVGFNASIALGKTFRMRGGSLGAEMTGGYRTIGSSTPFAASTSFSGSQETFDLLAPDSSDDAVLFGLSLIGDSELLTSRVGYDLRMTDETMTHIFGATLRLSF